MEIFNLNENIRNNLLNVVDKSYLKGNDLPDIIRQYCVEIYASEGHTNNQIMEYRNYTIGVLYLDALKLSLYKLKTCLVDDKIHKLYNRLNSINSMDDLHAEISADPFLLESIVNEAYQFCSLDFIGKSIIFKSLSNVQNQAISDIVPNHILDVSFYNRKINKDDLVFYMKNMYQYQNKYFEELASDSIITSIMGYIQMLKIYDEENYKSLLLEIGIIDYYVSLYLSDKLQDNNDVLDHIDYYENYSLLDIRKKLSLNQDFLINSIDMVYALYVEGNYEGINLKTDILYTNDKINNKLKYKKNS